MSKTYTVADIDMGDPLTSSVALAIALGSLSSPAKTGDKDGDAKAIIANYLTWFDEMGVDLTLRAKESK